MYDAASPSEPCPPALQRARGAVRVGFGLRAGATMLAELRQEGCLKARFPRPERGAWIGAALLNCSGGVAAGDHLSVAIDLAPGARAVTATQAAERIYRAPAGAAPALLRTRLTLGAGAALEFLPQETMIFDRAALDRRLDVEMAEDAWFLGAETLVFGRAEMGESVHQAACADLIRIRRGGRVILHDAVRLRGDVAARLDRRAMGNGARVVTTLVLVAQDAPSRLDAVRAVQDGKDGAVSSWDGMLVARILSPTAAIARARLLVVLATLRDGRPIPRVWMC